MNNSDFQNMEEEVSIKEQIEKLIIKIRLYFSVLSANKWKFVIINTVVLIVVLLYLFLLAKPYYISSVTILPDYGSKASMGNLSSLASLAGINIGGEGPSTEIYANLIKSESVLSPVIYSKYKTEEYADSVNLIEYFDIQSDDNESLSIREREKFLLMMKKLGETAVSTNLDKTTKILELNVRMPESKFAADVANKIVASLDNYIRTQRKSFATEQSYYLEKRIGQVKDSLEIAENRLRDFTDRNRGFINSPILMIEQGRLQREVEILQAVYIEITKQYELVQIEKIKDTPVLNIMEEAKDPIKKAGPKRGIILLGTLFFSVIVSGAYFMFKDEITPYIKLLRNK